MKELMTGSMREKMICLPNSKIVMMALMKLRLENMMKCNPTKKNNNLPVQWF